MERVYHFEQQDAASAARKKWKSRGWKNGDVVKAEKKKIGNEAAASASDAYARLVGLWRKDLQSAGSNNATRHASLVKVINQLDAQKPFSSRSVFCDMGSGCGLPCIYVALRFGCRVIGVEKDGTLVALARKYAEDAGVALLCSFFCEGFEKLSSDWVAENRVSHVFCFDGVFRPETWNILFNVVLCSGTYGSKELVGASVSKFSRSWPVRVQLIKKIGGVQLSASSSSFTFAVWVIGAEN
jgi:hypothetical protein